MSPPRDLVERLGDRLGRLPLVQPKKDDPLPVTVTRRRVYILPTGFGLFLGALLGAMLLGGLNYNNNPALMLAFLVAAVAHNSLVHAHLVLSGLRLSAVHAEPVHAGQPIELRLVFDASGNRRRPGLELRAGDAHAAFEVEPGERSEARLSLPTQRRGWWTPGRLRLSTLQPFGLARAWAWLQPQRALLVYPAVEADAVPLPLPGGDGQAARARAQGEQPHHLRDYRPGDAMRQIAWKASARSDRLLVREYEASASRDIDLDWFTLAHLGHEARIRRLARWVVDADRQGLRYRMRLPAQLIGPGRGADHRHACLRALALMPDG